MCNYINGVCDVCGASSREGCPPKGTKLMVFSTPYLSKDLLAAMMDDNTYTVVLTPAIESEIESDSEHLNFPTSKENTNNQAD